MTSSKLISWQSANARGFVLIIMGWWWSCQFYLKDKESWGYRIFDVEFQLHIAALSGELLPCSLSFFQSFVFINWPVIERKQSYTTLFQVNAWVEGRSKNRFLACTTANDLIQWAANYGSRETNNHTHHDWLVSRASARCSCALLGGLWWPIPFMLFEKNRSKWAIGDGVYVVEESAAGKVDW